MINDLIVLIVDDEPKVGEVLKTIIEKKINIGEKVIVYSASSVQEAKKLIESYSPDIVFLDIHMPEENGFELLKQVDSSTFEVVFTTAYEQYAIDAINDYNCLKYLLKPMQVEEVQSVFDKYREKEGYHYYYKILKNNSKRHIIKVEDIVFCKAADNYCEVYLLDTKYLVSKTLRAVCDKIQHKNFIRVNRSYFVNIDYVDHIDRTNNKLYFKKPILINNEEIEIDIIVASPMMKDLGKLNL